MASCAHVVAYTVITRSHVTSSSGVIAQCSLEANSEYEIACTRQAIVRGKGRTEPPRQLSPLKQNPLSRLGRRNPL